jgi:hypothetical protein
VYPLFSMGSDIVRTACGFEPKYYIIYSSVDEVTWNSLWSKESPGIEWVEDIQGLGLQCMGNLWLESLVFLSEDM